MSPTFKQQIAEALDSQLDGRERTLTPGEWLAPRVAAALDAVVMAERRACTKNHGRHLATRTFHGVALEALRGGA